MEDARKKLRVCLICVVAIAVFIGAAYYLSDINSTEHTSEGTLVETATDRMLADAGGNMEWL